MRVLGLTLLVPLLGALLGGCTFHRLQSNHQFEAIDPGKIQVGSSTWRDVLTEFGPPSGATTERIRGMDGMVTFRYSQADQKTVTVLLAYILYLPFRWGDNQSGSEMVVEFDVDGVVADLYSVEGRAAWRPFQEPGDRKVTFYRDEATP